MNSIRYRLVIVFLVSALLIGFGALKAKATEIVDLTDYDKMLPVGSWWKYSYIYPSEQNDFTVSITKITSGPYIGKLRKGDWYEYHPNGTEIRWMVYDIFEENAILYEESGQTYDPPLVINTNDYVTELECFLNCSVYPGMDINPLPEAYVRREEKITVPAGTFYDILVKFHIDSDKAYPLNSANYIYGLDPVEVPYAVTHIRWYARNIGEVKGVDIDSATGNIVHRYELNSFHIPDSDGVPADIQGTVTHNGTPLCAMVLANGQYMFSCGENQGTYELDVPLDENDEITLFAFVDGLAPFKQILTPSEALDFDIEMQLASPDSKTPNVTSTVVESTDTSGWVKIGGFVTLDGIPLCAMVLANGQYMFSCSGDGSYSLDVPLDGNGEITLFTFVDGLQPYKEIIRP